MKFEVYSKAGRFIDANQCEVNIYETLLQPTKNPFAMGEIEINSLEGLRDFTQECKRLSQQAYNPYAVWKLKLNGYCPASTVDVRIYTKREYGFDGRIIIKDGEITL